MKRLKFTCDLIPLITAIGFELTSRYETEVCNTEIYWYKKLCIEIDYMFDSSEVIISTMIACPGGEVLEVSVESIADIKALDRMVNYEEVEG